jgi:hypothetical protein
MISYYLSSTGLYEKRLCECSYLQKVQNLWYKLRQTQQLQKDSLKCLMKFMTMHKLYPQIGHNGFVLCFAETCLMRNLQNGFWTIKIRCNIFVLLLQITCLKCTGPIYDNAPPPKNRENNS